MQRNRTKFGKIVEMTHLFNFDDLFINPGMDSEEWRKFREFAQQEFMIKGELDFSLLDYYKIICTSEDDKKQLINLLGIDSINIINKILVDNSYYRNENPAVNCVQLENIITISTKKQAEGHFILSSEDINLIQILEGDDY